MNNSKQPFENTEQFLRIFGSFEETPYKNLTHLTDRKVGFSIIRDYPDDLLFKPAKTKEGKADSVALIHVVYVHPEESKKEFVPERVPVTISITTRSLFLRKGHIDYNYEDCDSPTRESVQASRKTSRPIALDSFDDFHFSHHSDRFCDEKQTGLTGLDVLNSIYEKHCNTARRFKGLPTRTKFRLRTIVAAGLEKLASVVSWSLEAMFGRTIKEEERVSAFLSGYSKDALILLSEDSVNLFGYKAPKRSVVTFATSITLIALLYAVFGSEGSQFLERLFSNPLFSVSIGIFLLWFVSSIVPRLLFFLLNRCIRLRTRVWFWRLKV